MNNYFYARVSTKEQNTDRQLASDVAVNIEDDNIFIDKCSGKNTNRPGLTELLTKIKPGDHLYCHEISRLGRNLQDLINISEELTSNGVTLHFIKEGLTLSNDKDNVASQLVFRIMSAIAEFERQMILNRQREGIELAKEQGKYNGRPATKFNQDLVDVTCEKYINREYSLSKACENLTYTTKNGDVKCVSIPTFYKMLDAYCAEHEVDVQRYSINRYRNK